VINELIIDKVIAVLQDRLIGGLPAADPARAGLVMKGPLQGDPDPDQARIAVTIHENDPDAFYPGAVTGMTGSWEDEKVEVEDGGDLAGVFWARRFTVKARVLLVSTGESLEDARRIAQLVKKRIEQALLTIDWDGVSDGDERISLPAEAGQMKSEAVQAGGPESYDYFVKVRFEVQTELDL